MYNFTNYNNIEVLAYDCDGNEITEFRILRFSDSACITNWDEEPNIDPRFYCLVKLDCDKVYAISVYDDYNSEYIRKYENMKKEEKIPTIIKSIEEMEYYEVAFSGITGNEWYYDRDKDKLKKKLEEMLHKNKHKLIKKLY